MEDWSYHMGLPSTNKEFTYLLLVIGEAFALAGRRCHFSKSCLIQGRVAATQALILNPENVVISPSLDLFKAVIGGLQQRKPLLNPENAVTSPNLDYFKAIIVAGTQTLAQPRKRCHFSKS